MWFKKWSPVILIFMVSGSISLMTAQSDFLDNYKIRQASKFNNKLINVALSEIERKLNIVFTYAGSPDFEQEIKGLPDKDIPISEFLKIVFAPRELEVLQTAERRFLLRFKKPSFRSEIFGYIREIDTRELVSGALVIDKSTGNTELSNDKGYYYLKLSPYSQEIEVRSLGYDNAVYNLKNFPPGQVDLFINFNNEIAPLIISSSTIDATLFDPATISVVKKKWQNTVGILGDYDYIKSLSGLGGIVVGGEGQNGMVLRGGGYDQTAILLEGMPMYETNHIVGLSSIFVSEGVRAVDVFKNGLPARYNGRLAGVVNVHLKDGNANRNRSNLDLGIFGLKFHIEGLIHKTKTSYSIALRQSWIDYLFRPFLTTLSN